MTRRETSLLLVRHGRTDWNRLGRWHGRADIALDEVGLRQAKALADHVAELHVDAVVASPLGRAAQTAAASGRALGLPVAHQEGLLEVDVGEWQGLTEHQVNRLEPTYASARATRRFSASGETPAECGERVAGALRELAARHVGERLLVVSHAYAIRAGVVTLLGCPVEAIYGFADPYNCAYAELSLSPTGSGRLLAWNSFGEALYRLGLRTV